MVVKLCAAVAVVVALEVVGFDSLLRFPLVKNQVVAEVGAADCNFATVLERAPDNVVDDLEEEEEEADVVWQNMHVGPVGEEDAVDEIEVAAAVVDDQKRQRDAVHEDYVDNVRLEWLVLVFVVVGAGVESAEPGSEDTVVVVVVVEDED